MSENNYLLRVPLLDPKQQVMGYKLAWQKKSPGSEAASAEDLQQLLAFVAGRANDAQSGVFFLHASPETLSAEALQTLSPQHTVLMLDQVDMFNLETVASAASLRERGFGFAVRNADLASLESNVTLLPLMKYVEVRLGHPDLAAITRLGKNTKPPFSVLVDHFPDWRAFDANVPLGLHGFFENLCLAPHKLSLSGKLSPQTVLILQLMQMVQENADVRHLEQVLKRDTTLSYKLFRYINSASFGVEVEIQSLRHAVSMLGYSPLFRWLSLLLATTNTAGFSPALLQAAIVRGRFIELLGQGLLSKSESENLFVVGMFSLLDRLLGVSIQEVMAQILLPEAIVQALLSREGVYGPFLALVEACEREDGRASDLADALLMTSTRVNQAHMAALEWAQNIKL